MAIIIEKPPFRLVFSTIEDGNMARTQANREEVHRNRLAFIAAHSPDDYSIVRVRPSHSSNIDVLSTAGETISRVTYIRRPRIDTDFDFYLDGSDGIVTSQRRVSLSVIAGDCVPVLLWNRHGGAFGIIHIGLLGTLNNLVAGLTLPLKQLGFRPDEMEYYLGPSISQSDYDLSKSGLWRAIEPQVRGSPTLSGEVEPYLDQGSFFDMKGMIRGQLLSLGVPPGQIDEYAGSTAALDSRFFSHYTAIQQGSAPGNFCSLICSLDS